MSPATAPASSRERLQDIYWRDDDQTRGSVMARSRPLWFEQAELWTEAPARAKPVESPAPVARAASLVAARATAMARPPARTVRVSAPEIVLAKGRASAKPGIARLLQVNDAVYGAILPSGDFRLPRSRFRAGLQLWKGKEIGTPFISGC